MENDFDGYIGIDWSGAKGSRHKGIAVAYSDKGKALCLIQPPNQVWSRQEVYNFILEESLSKKLLIGIDFSFSYPFIDVGSFFPCGPCDQPTTAYELWRKVEEISHNSNDFYGGNIWKHDDYSDFYNSPIKRGSKFLSRRRLTEIFSKKYRSPSPTFNCIGPGGVGT